MRICSLVPAATEILFALGLGDQIVAVSHACEAPPEARALPRATTCDLDASVLSSAEIDAWVATMVSGGNATYHLDRNVLRAARPDLIITQELCGVCAIDASEIRRAAADLVPRPRLLAIEPRRLSDVFAIIRAIGEETGTSRRAEDLAARLELRIAALRARLAGVRRANVLCLEWLDPPWVAGHWVPEAVDAAGGNDVAGRPGEPARRVTWREIARADPEVVFLMPCGFDVQRTLQEVDILFTIPETARIAAFQTGDVFAVNGARYFSAPGPGLADGVELLASILHPQRVDQAASPERALRVPWPAVRPHRDRDV